MIKVCFIAGMEDIMSGVINNTVSENEAIANEFVSKFNEFWNATNKIKRSDIINILERVDKDKQAASFRNILSCDVSYMSDEYLVSTMRLVAACGNKKSIVLGHLSSGNKMLEKMSDSFYAIQRLTKKYNEVEEKEIISKGFEEKCKVAENLASVNKEITDYFSSNNITLTDVDTTATMYKNVMAIKAELEGKREVLGWQISSCSQTKSSKAYYNTIKSVREFKNTLCSNVDGKMAIVAYRGRKDLDKKGLFESKFKYQSRMASTINNVFAEIEQEINTRKDKIDYICNSIEKRSSALKLLANNAEDCTLQDIGKITKKYISERAINDELLDSFKHQKSTLKKQIATIAQDVNLNYIAAMSNEIELVKQ